MVFKCRYMFQFTELLHKPTCVHAIIPQEGQWFELVLSMYFPSSFKSSYSSGDIAKMFDMAEVELLSKLNKILGSSGCLKKCSTPKK